MKAFHLWRFRLMSVDAQTLQASSTNHGRVPMGVCEQSNPLRTATGVRFGGVLSSTIWTNLPNQIRRRRKTSSKISERDLDHRPKQLRAQTSNPQPQILNFQPLCPGLGLVSCSCLHVWVTSWELRYTRDLSWSQKCKGHLVPKPCIPHRFLGIHIY